MFDTYSPTQKVNVNAVSGTLSKTCKDKDLTEEKQMDKKEYEEIERKANELEHNASIKCNAEVQKAQNFYNGYQQGIEDMLKILRRN